MARAAWVLMLAGGLVASPGAMASAAEVEVSEAARSLFREGVEHLKADPPRYVEAYEAFKRAYEDSPSPKILGNLGLAATMLERDGEAIAAYTRYLEEAGAKSDREQQQIKADLALLEQRVSRLRLTVSPPAVTIVDRRTKDDGGVVENRYTVTEGAIDLGLRAGNHRLTIEAEGHRPKELTLTLEQGVTHWKEIALVSDVEPSVVPLPEPEPDAEAAPLGMWIAVGATGALAVATAVVGGLAAANHASYEEASGEEAADLRETGQTLNIAGDVLLGVTLAAAATSVVLVALELTEEDPEVVAAPVVTPHGAFVGLGGRF